MAMIRNILVPIFLISFNSLSILGQAIQYDYDESGNRVSRYIVLEQGMKSLEETGDASLPDKFEDKQGEITFKIYPNPTEGKLYIEIDGISPEQTTDYQLHSQGGILLITRKEYSCPFTIEMNGYPGGLYILSIVIDGKKSQWKIIKK